MRPIGPTADPDVQAVLKLVRDSDVGFANLETNVTDPPDYAGPMRGFNAPASIIPDIKSWGIKMVNRANNHVNDSGDEGLMETVRLLEKAGVVSAGTGRNFREAESAQYLETPKGRIGIFAMHSSEGASVASDGDGTAFTPPSAGLNPLRLTTYINVTQADIDTLRKVRDSTYVVNDEVVTAGPPPGGPRDPKDRITIGTTNYRAGGTVGSISYTISPDEMRRIVRGIKNGKYFSDFMITTIHAHQGKWVAERFPQETSTPDFLIELAHRAIDSGSDAFLGHGPHALRGIEIYRGKPIFYGLGQFVRESDWRLITPQNYTARGENPDTTELTRAEVGMWTTPRDKPMYRSIVAINRYDGGQLREVRLYPVDLGWERPLSKVGIPALAKGAVAQEILLQIQKLSRPFGTDVRIQGEVGVIAVGAPATAPRNQH
jgi:poly-gamma-glutamate synthesis protein (capsule biosynthesis protein)